MVDDGDDSLHSPHAGQYAADPDQHAGGVPVAARMSRDLRKRRNREHDAHRGELHWYGLSVGDVQRDGGLDQGLSPTHGEVTGVDQFAFLTPLCLASQPSVRGAALVLK